MKIIKYSLIILILPKLVFGSGIRITEIMYDVPGTDSGFEWIEVFNAGQENIDLTTYKFFENNTAHSISYFSTPNLLTPGSYAIVADNAEKFINSFANLPTSQIYDSAFSLSNSMGEYLAIKNGDGNILHELTYDVAVGAAGDGSSLHILESGSFVSGPPTPLTAYSGNSGDVASNPITVVSASSSSPETAIKKSPKGFVLDIPKIVVVNSLLNLKPILYGDSGQTITRGYFVVNFGDGDTITTDTLGVIKHNYLNKGNYVLSLIYKYDAWSPDNVYSAKYYISVIDHPFEITKLTDGIVMSLGIKNIRDSEYDLGSYLVRGEDVLVTIPKNTYVSGNSEVFIRLPKSDKWNRGVVLLDSSGNIVSSLNTKPVSNVTYSSLPISASVGANSYIEPDYFTEDTNNIKPIILDNTSVTNDSTSSKTYYALIFIIVLASVLVFLIKKQNQRKNADLSSEEYALQDE